MIARTTCDKNEEKLSVNAINLTDKSAKVARDTLLGRLDPIFSVKTFSVVENSENSWNWTWRATRTPEMFNW